MIIMEESIYTRLGHGRLADANKAAKVLNLYSLLQVVLYSKDLTQGRCGNFAGSDR